MKQVEGNEEYHGVIDDPSSASGILFQGLIFVIKQGEGKKRGWREADGGEKRVEKRLPVSHLSLSFSPRRLPVGQVNSFHRDGSGAAV